MNIHSKHDHDSFDDLVIFSCKGIVWTLLGIGGLCAAIALYGFFQYLISLAIN